MAELIRMSHATMQEGIEDDEEEAWEDDYDRKQKGNVKEVCLVPRGTLTSSGTLTPSFAS